MTPEVDAYIERSTKWPQEMAELRPILLGCGLSEDIKWNKPCYSAEGANILILQEMNDFLAIMFFKGALLEDPEDVLRDQGPNSRSARRIELTSPDDVSNLRITITEYVQEAIDVEKAGLEVGPAPELVLVAELQDRLDNDSHLREAFEALTAGRRREYNLHFSSAKQAKTRESRIDKFVPKILAGKGFRDRWTDDG